MNVSKVINLVLLLIILLLLLRYNMRVENRFTEPQVSLSSRDSVMSSREENIIYLEDNFGNRNNVVRIINQRQNPKNFTDKKVSKEYLESLVRSGMSASSVYNLQPWMFIVVDNRDLILKLGSEVSNFELLTTSQALILVCGNMDKTLDGNVSGVYWLQDCAAASENILITAYALGLDAVWITIYPEDYKIKKVREILNIPDNIIPTNIIPIGYAKDVIEVKNKFKLENLHWNKWEVKY